MNINPTQASAAAPALCVDEHEAARAVGLSVFTLRKDRQGPRRIPFVKIGGAVRYRLDSVRAALADMEQGGPQARPQRRTAAA